MIEEGEISFSLLTGRHGISNFLWRWHDFSSVEGELLGRPGVSNFGSGSDVSSVGGRCPRIIDGQTLSQHIGSGSDISSVGGRCPRIIDGQTSSQQLWKWE